MSDCFRFKTFEFQCGIFLRDVEIVYQTYRELKDDRSNAILYPTSYGAQHSDSDFPRKSAPCAARCERRRAQWEVLMLMVTDFETADWTSYFCVLLNLLHLKAQFPMLNLALKLLPAALLLALPTTTLASCILGPD